MPPFRGRSSLARTAPVLALFFLSGIAALVYEVVWTRFLVLFLGNTAHAHAVVLATFMGGLAVGYEMFGKRADQLGGSANGARKLLLVYAALEGAIGLYGLIFPLLMGQASSVFLSAARSIGPDSALLVPLALAVSTSVLVLPTVLMGGTLPVLITWAAGEPDEAGQAVARFYALNSAGAVIGAIGAGFWMIEHLGQRGTVTAAAVLNLLLALGALGLSRVLAPSRPSSDGPSEGSAVAEDGQGESPYPRAEPEPRPWHSTVENVPTWLPLAVAFISGVAALLLEVVWIRLFTLVYGSSTQSFTVIVAAFITGITIGAVVCRRLLVRTKRPLLLLAVAAAASAAMVLFAQPAYAWLPYWLGKMRIHFGADNAFLRFHLAKFALSFAFMIVPTALSGIVLPLAVHLASRTRGHTGRQVGRVFAWNTAGSVLAASLAGTVIIPALSMRGSLVLAVLLYLGIAFMAAASEHEAPQARTVLIGLGLFAVVLPVFEWKVGWDKHILNAGEFRRNTALPSHADWLKEQRKAKLTFYEEGPTTTVAVMSLDDGKRYLKVNGKADASNWGDVMTQAGIGAIGSLLANGIDSAMVIGFGSGVTVNSLLKFGLDVDVVEIEPAVLHASEQFKDVNDGCLKDPHLHVHLGDARTFMQTATRKYDVIISEPSNPWVAGIGSLFTKEFFDVVKGRLAEGGAFVQWFHLYDMDDDMVRLILRTLGDTFPDVTLWHIENDIALVARSTPLERNLDRMEARFRLTPVREYFNRIGIYDLYSLLSLQMASEEGFRKSLDPGPLHVDDLPLLEYRAPRAQFARSYSFYLLKYDERHFADRSQLLFADYARDHKVGLNEMLDFTILQSNQPFAPEVFRFRLFDKVLELCKEPWTLARIVANLEHTKRFKESEKTLAALQVLDPGSPRTMMLRAQVILRRLGNAKAGQDPEMREVLAECVKSPAKGGDLFRNTCREFADTFGIALPK